MGEGGPMLWNFWVVRYSVGRYGFEWSVKNNLV